MDYPHRLHQVRQQLLTHAWDGLIISKRENLIYLTGLMQLDPTNREAILLLTPRKNLLYHSPFLSPPHVSGLTSQPMDRTHPPATVFPQVFTLKPEIKIGIEAHNYTVAETERLQSILPQAIIVNTTEVIENLRLLKDAGEIRNLRRAGRLTARLMNWAIKELHRHHSHPVTETSFSRLLEAQAYALGADGLAFPSVVAFGSHTASPHHIPGKSKLSPGPVLLDLGVEYHGYCGDMTRTIYLGTPPPQFIKIQKVVQSAYHAALNLLPNSMILTGTGSKLSATKIDVLASTLDLATRSVIEKSGYGQYFIHTTGHGLGLEIHEAPSLNSQNPQPLQPGMVITIEPGIYIPHRFGYRFENSLAITPPVS